MAEIRELHVVSGIPPGNSGTGRLLTQLETLAARDTTLDVKLHYPRRPLEHRRRLIKQGKWLSALVDWLQVAFSWGWLRLSLQLLARTSAAPVVFFHPQTLGYRRTEALMARWRGPVFMFGLDNSFFCIRSYNHRLGMDTPCLNCLGGRFEAADEHGCTPFPTPDPEARGFVRRLRELMIDGRVHVLAQNKRNAELYRRHLGPNASVAVVGLWTADLTPEFETPRTAPAGRGYDVVFHGHYVEAKGAEWMLDVARAAPELKILFPAACPKRVQDPPANVTFKSMNWETGLAEEVAKARLVTVPSLWSATIEGALVKTIIAARATARVDNPTAYGDELPAGLVLNLDREPTAAARQLREALARDWAPEPALLAAWKQNFLQENYPLLNKIIAIISQVVNRPAAATPAPHGLLLEKLGTAYGGWTVPVERISADWICYCVGAGEDISFDCALTETFGCEVFVIDPTPRAVSHFAELSRRIGAGETMPVNHSTVDYTLSPAGLARLHFQPVGLWSEDTVQRFYVPKNAAHVSHSILNLQKTEDYFEAECLSLPTLMQRLGHQRIDLLKVDIEGAEYEVLRGMLKHRVFPRVLCIEFDEGNMPLDSGAPQRIEAMKQELVAAGYTFIRQDGWNALFMLASEFA